MHTLQWRFNSNTKLALKVAIALCCAIFLALLFELQKPYWSAMAVHVLAISETLHSGKRKGLMRLIGTLSGSLIGIITIAVFPQQPLYFLMFTVTLFALCNYAGSDNVWGYAFIITFMVYLIVVVIGGLDSSATINIAILRMQETLLGVVVYSVIFSILWPDNDEQQFSHDIDIIYKSADSLRQLIRQHPEKTSYHLDSFVREPYHDQDLADFLATPKLNIITPSRKNRSHENKLKAAWVTKHLTTRAHQQGIDKNHLEILDLALSFLHQTKVSDQSVLSLPRLVKDFYHLNKTPNPSFLDRLIDNWRTRFCKTLVGTVSLVTAILMWLYIPVPSGTMFVLNMSICAILLSNMPQQMIKHWFVGYTFFGVIFLAQYVFILPELTEVYQLLLFYAINIFIIYKSFSTIQWFIYKVLGGNLLLMMTMTATQQSPSYDIVTPLYMLVYTFLALAILRIYLNLFTTANT